MTTRQQLSPTSQKTLVGDGLAVGLHAIDVAAFTAKGSEVEMAFNHAWPTFPLASTMFRAIKASFERCNLPEILDHSPRRRSSDVAWHIKNGWWEPHLRYADSYQEVADLMRRSHGILPSIWMELAEPFVAKLGEERVRRD
ncbi:hypothetical protein RB614_40540 [Phytohabitans sp. ZYX-F-186]|uniref:Uncharacterized protein n=1 Tax=Phytohabitans maris TaxID=3071409 RepID=A0ABU0ZUS6_9ACTN|nr:hypothetical protein [Phytohabitans sp. ZYX-F-186]MDQ7910799.1 hypothetical protein [Phytohabitans sp. ZYX-F-186]